MKNILLIIFITVFMCSCKHVGDEQIKRLSSNMPKDTVISIIEFEPNQIEFDNYGEIRENCYFTYWGDDKYKHVLCVTFVKDKMKSFYTY